MNTSEMSQESTWQQQLLPWRIETVTLDVLLNLLQETEQTSGVLSC